MIFGLNKYNTVQYNSKITAFWDMKQCSLISTSILKELLAAIVWY